MKKYNYNKWDNWFKRENDDRNNEMKDNGNNGNNGNNEVKISGSKNYQ